MNIYQLGEFRLNSGRVSRFKLECDAWTDQDIECFAYLITQLVGPFGSVEGVLRGGLKLAIALSKYIWTIGDPHLIVDDVLTTGKSMEKIRSKYDGSQERIKGAVVYARGPVPNWIKAVETINPELWGV